VIISPVFYFQHYNVILIILQGHRLWDDLKSDVVSVFGRISRLHCGIALEDDASYLARIAHVTSSQRIAAASSVCCCPGRGLLLSS
jgi:hypothetical protein